MPNKAETTIEKDPEATSEFIPPREVFEDGGKVVHAEPGEGQIDNEIIAGGRSVEDGMLIFRKGDQFPSKGWIFRYALIGINVAKRSAIEDMRMAIKAPFRYVLPIFFILPNSLKKKIMYLVLERYTKLTDCTFQACGAYIKPEFYCKMVREINRVGMEMAGEDLVMKNLVRTLCMILEFDDAYRYRFQDLFELVNLVAMRRNPGKELARIFRIAVQRGAGTSEKFETIAKMLPFLLSLKSIRGVVIEFFEKVDISKLVLDEMDWYKCLIWGGYSFRGIPDIERVAMRMTLDAAWMNESEPKKFDGNPQLIPV